MPLTSQKVKAASHYYMEHAIKRRRVGSDLSQLAIRNAVEAFDLWLDSPSASDGAKTFYEAARALIPGAFKTTVGKPEIELLMAATLLARSAIVI